MFTYARPIFLISMFAIALSSCTRATSDKSQVTVTFPQAMSSTSLKISSSVGALATSKWQLPAPTLGTDINCYALLFKYPEGTKAQTCSDPSGTFGPVDDIFGAFAAGSTVEIDIPSGSARHIGLVGFHTDDITKCNTIPNSGGGLNTGHFSPPVIITAVRKDIAAGSDQIDFSIPSTLNGFVFEDCAPKAFASSTDISAELTGVPTGSTSSTSIAVTVGGYNVSEYQYVVTTSPTCVGQTYSAFLPIASPIIATGLTQNTYSLCVIGKSPYGDIQTFATLKNWTVDTTAGVATSIAVGNATSNNPYEPVTVTGTSPGDVVQVFEGPACNSILGVAAATSTTTIVIPTFQYTEGPPASTITARLQDSLGNVGLCSSLAGVSATFSLDTTPPPAVSLYMDNIYSPSVLNTPVFTWGAVTDTNSGVRHYEVSVDGGAWVNNGTLRNYYSLIPQSPGAHSVQIRSVDFTGNYSTAVSDTYTVNSTALWNQQSYIKSLEPDSLDSFGYAVAVDGDFMVVGAPLESSSRTGVTNSAFGSNDNSVTSSGAVFIYQRNYSGQWAQVAYVKSPDPRSQDNFGKSVAISKNTIVVGAPGETSTSRVIVNSAVGDSTVTSLNAIGAAYVFVFDGTGWSQQAYLKSPNSHPTTNNWFGQSVAIENDMIVVGAPYLQDASVGTTTTPAIATDTVSSGGAYIFKRNVSSWSFDTFLKPPLNHNSMLFGYSTAISSGTIVVTAPHEGSRSTSILPNSGSAAADGSFNGAAYVFVKPSTTWVQQAYIKPPIMTDGDLFGMSVSLFNDLLVVGAKADDSGLGPVSNGAVTDDNTLNNSGAAHVFKRTGTAWTHEAFLKSSNRRANDSFGTSVSVWGSTILVGATGESSCATSVSATAAVDTSCPYSGAAYAFERDAANNWSQTNYFKASNNNTSATAYPSSSFGVAVSINGTSVVVGSDKEGSNALGVINGSTPAPATSGPTQAGAVYIYFP